jgi:hypothetical protein
MVYESRNQGAICYGIRANFIDCRLNAYPILSEDDISAGIQAPNIIFIDIDLSQGSEINCGHSLIELNKILNNTLKTIKNKLNGSTCIYVWNVLFHSRYNVVCRSNR